MKTRIIFLLLLCTVMVYGQVVKVKNHYSLTSQVKERAFYPVFNPEGTQLLYTTENYKGLNLYYIQTGEVKVIAGDAGAGYSPMFSSDSKKIYYKQTTKKDGRQYKSLMSFDQTAGKSVKLSEPLRSLKEVNIIQKQVIKKTAALSSVSVSTENLKIVLYRDGKRTEMEPVGKVAGYIWTSLSPNRKMILFTATSKGTFVCDLEGKVVASLGKLNAPVWYDDSYVVGMVDKDNGSFITSSQIVMASLDGKLRQTLTPDDTIALYPAASATSQRIAYSTPKGELYIMEIEINR